MTTHITGIVAAAGSGRTKSCVRMLTLLHHRPRQQLTDTLHLFTGIKVQSPAVHNICSAVHLYNVDSIMDV